MKAGLAGLIVISVISSSFAEPGGTYTLTGKEKGIGEIIKADMEQYPELYKGDSFDSYLSRFKAENKIGYKKYKPGDQLKFPSTSASRRIKNEKNEKGSRAAKIDCELNTIRIKKDAAIFTDTLLAKFVDIPDEYKNEEIIFLPLTSTRNGRDPIEINVKNAGYVYCVVAGRKGIARLEKEGWEVILNEGFTYHCHKIRNLAVLKKYYEKGEYKIPSVDGIGTRVIIK